MNKYYEAQKRLRVSIEENEEKKTQEKILKITEACKKDMNEFWKQRRKLLGKTDDLYDTITEEGTLIEDPREAKEHIANYFENLSHARPGKPEYEDWTNKITEKLVQLEKEQLKLPNSDPITLEEKNDAIKMLKRNKANGPDGIPNEALKEADQNTRIM